MTQFDRTMVKKGDFLVSGPPAQGQSVTDPQSVPAELQAAVPAAMVPFVPIVRQEQKRPYALLESLRIEHSDRVLRAFHYSSLDALVDALDEKIIKPAEARFAKLQAKKVRG
jgi:hypothetical protein